MKAKEFKRLTVWLLYYGTVYADCSLLQPTHHCSLLQPTNLQPAVRSVHKLRLMGQEQLESISGRKEDINNSERDHGHFNHIYRYTKFCHTYLYGIVDPACSDGTIRWMTLHAIHN